MKHCQLAPAQQWQSRARKLWQGCTLPQAERLPIQPDADTARAGPVFPLRVRGLRVGRCPRKT